MKKKIILIGYRGVGKSYIGKKLANYLNYPFYDLDDELEKKYGKIINIVQQKGWKHFRNLETLTLKENLKKTNTFVISTGGGIIEKKENFKILKKSEFFKVWITASIDSIIYRLEKSLDRPSLLIKESLLNETKVILSKRIPLYKSLKNITINNDLNQKINFNDFFN